MIKTIKIFESCILITAFTATYYAFSTPAAFPGAEGFGKYTTGGRGGSVYHVTNLNDSGPGSFRDAVSAPDRIVVFDVGGVIRISSRIVIKKNIYIAGQTAPGGGITVCGNGIALNDDSGNDIIRYIRIRMGKNSDDRKDALAVSADKTNFIPHSGRQSISDENALTVIYGIDGRLFCKGVNEVSRLAPPCLLVIGKKERIFSKFFFSGALDR